LRKTREKDVRSRNAEPVLRFDQLPHGCARQFDTRFVNVLIDAL